MNDYELTVLVKADLGDKEVDKEIKNLQTTFGKAGAKIKSKADPVKKQMAYLIGKAREAYYFYVELTMEGDRALEIENKLKLEDNVVRYLLVRKGG